MKTSTRFLALLGGCLLAGILVNTTARAQALPPGSFSVRQTTQCSTAGTINTPCTNSTITLPTSFSNPANYVCVATCTGPSTGVPAVQSITKAAASPKIQVIITNLTAATATCNAVEVTCTGVNSAAL